MLGALYVINIIISLVIVFLDRKNPSATLAWIMVLFLVPGFGILLYFAFSQNISRQKIFTMSYNEELLLTTSLKHQNQAIENGKFVFENDVAKKWQDLIKMNQVYSAAYFTQDNDIQYFSDGEEKMRSLFTDIKNAKESINIEYFILKHDIVGDSLLNALIEKAKEGVKVRLLVDALGSWSINKNLVNELVNAGGSYAEFFPTKWKFFNTKINYRNHRKLAIIDDDIGYIGGFNIAREYVGLKRKFGYWRDAHIRIRGGSVCDINARFLLDWRSATKEKINMENVFFEPKNTPGSIGVQIVSSGPDEVLEQIKRGLLKMITSAKKNIYIQTPYFVPDVTILECLKMAAQSGVDVNIMIPCIPDHMFVYWATYSYVSEIMKAGGKVYIYDNGFLHAKTMAVDDEVCTVGSANFDIRSFKLNFEANAFIFDEQFTKKVVDSFKEDINLSHMLTKELYAQRVVWIKIKEAFSRVLSDIL